MCIRDRKGAVPLSPPFQAIPSLVNYLKEHPNKEKEYRLSLGYGLGSTHYWYWDPKTNMFMHSRDWDFEPYTASQVVKWYGEGKWKIEQ